MSDLLAMIVTRSSLEGELIRLRQQRARYLRAARTCAERQLALKHLLNVERLGDELEAVETALEALDEPTIPIDLGPDPEIDGLVTLEQMPTSMFIVRPSTYRS
jgi:hypothetical protein